MKVKIGIVLLVCTLAACSSHQPLFTMHVEYTGLPVSELRCLLENFAQEQGFRLSEGKNIPQAGSEPRFFYYLYTAEEYPAALDNIGNVGHLTIFVYSESALLKNGETRLQPLFEALREEIQKKRELFAEVNGSAPSNCF